MDKAYAERDREMLNLKKRFLFEDLLPEAVNKTGTLNVSTIKKAGFDETDWPRSYRLDCVFDDGVKVTLDLANFIDTPDIDLIKPENLPSCKTKNSIWK